MQETSERGSQLYYELGQSRLLEQQNRNHVIETKASWVLGFSATLVGIMGLVLPEAASWAKWPAMAGVVCFLLTGLCISQALRVRGFHKEPTPKQLQQHLDDYPESAPKKWVADAITDC